MMNQIEIKQFLHKKEFPQELVEDLSYKLKPVKVLKNECFIDYFQKMNKLGILVNGLLVSRYTNEEGEEITSKFYYPKGDTIVVDFHCFKNQSDSSEQIKAIEDSILLVINHSDYLYLLSKTSMKKVVISFAEKSYIKGLNRIRDFQQLDTSKRVEKFVKENKEIIDKLQKKDMASYLGMNRNLFSVKLKKFF